MLMILENFLFASVEVIHRTKRDVAGRKLRAVYIKVSTSEF